MGILELLRDAVHDFGVPKLDFLGSMGDFWGHFSRFWSSRSQILSFLDGFLGSLSKILGFQMRIWVPCRSFWDTFGDFGVPGGEIWGFGGSKLGI